jgi:hypothetical protein
LWPSVSIKVVAWRVPIERLGGIRFLTAAPRHIFPTVFGDSLVAEPFPSNGTGTCRSYPRLSVCLRTYGSPLMNAITKRPTRQGRERMSQVHTRMGIEDPLHWFQIQWAVDKENPAGFRQRLQVALNTLCYEMYGHGWVLTAYRSSLASSANTPSLFFHFSPADAKTYFATGSNVVDYLGRFPLADISCGNTEHGIHQPWLGEGRHYDVDSR